MPGSPVRDRARELIAAQVDLLGPPWRNTANLIRTGYENLWLTPALNALEAVLRMVPADADNED